MSRFQLPSIRMRDYGVDIGRHDGCSQGRKSVSSPRTIEGGVEIIEEILKKNVLCRHDVEDINQVYRAIDFLERRVEQIPKHNSQHALAEIIKKVEGILSARDFNARDLISLYHLQNFLDKDLHISKHFNSLISKFKDHAEENEAIATDLPYCYSEVQFDEDIAALIGHKRTDKATKILNQKKERLKSYESIEQAIANEKLKLEKNRKQDPNNYPAYFDELLEKGYIHLYDHLMQMRALPSRNARRLEIEKMTFSLISHVVLETREAVIQKVESSIPSDRNNILFLLGGSGSGKSTALCFLRGDEIVLEKFLYKSRNEKNKLIGHEGATSCTFLPTVEVVNNLVIVDFPGFDDTNGPIISMGMEFALKALLGKYHSQILVLEAITNTEGRFAAAAQLGLRLSRLLDNKENCILGITKYSKDPDFGQIRMIEEQQKKTDWPQLKKKLDLLQLSRLFPTLTCRTYCQPYRKSSNNLKRYSKRRVRNYSCLCLKRT